MIDTRKSDDRGGFDHGWLKTKHTFSFSEYYDPKFMGFSVLRVINEDHIIGGSGFGTHPHNDMEIVTYIISGALEHKDSMGNSEVIRPGEMQRMSAGTGVKHSEFNHYRDRDTHLLQIWLLPAREGVAPSYAQKNFADRIENENLVLTVSPDGRDGSISINQDVSLYVGRAHSDGVAIELPLSQERKGWLQIISGEVKFLSAVGKAGDGIAIVAEARATAICRKGSHFLFFDLPD